MSGLKKILGGVAYSVLPVIAVGFALVGGHRIGYQKGIEDANQRNILLLNQYELQIKRMEGLVEGYKKGLDKCSELNEKLIEELFKPNKPTTPMFQNKPRTWDI